MAPGNQDDSLTFIVILELPPMTESQENPELADLEQADFLTGKLLGEELLAGKMVDCFQVLRFQGLAGIQAVPSFSGFSDHLFWDVDRENLEVGKYRGWLKRRVLEKGTLADWELLLEIYGREEVGDAVKQLPGLEK